MTGKLCIAALLTCTAAIAQSPTAPPQTPPAFDVVSIKPAKPGDPWHYGFAPTGYSAAGVSLGAVILQAYFPFNMAGKETLVGAPDWVWKDLWDIEAKVAPEAMAAYQQQRTRINQPNPMNQQLLQSMLTDRFGLVAHRIPAEMDGYALVIAKNGPKLAEAPPGEQQPSGGIPAPGGGYMVPYRRGDLPHITFYSVSMAGFATDLRGMAGGPVVDRTGLTGTYDFTLNWLSSGPDEEHAGAVSMDDPDRLAHWNLRALGLRAEQVKLPTEHIVIDHIEKPSAD